MRILFGQVVWLCSEANYCTFRDQSPWMLWLYREPRVAEAEMCLYSVEGEVRLRIAKPSRRIARSYVIRGLSGEILVHRA